MLAHSLGQQESQLSLESEEEAAPIVGRHSFWPLHSHSWYLQGGAHPKLTCFEMQHGSSVWTVAVMSTAQIIAPGGNSQRD